MKPLSIALIIVLVFSSCSDDDGNRSPNGSRKLRYELTGNFSGSNIITAYTTASGGTVTEQITALPWNKEITFDAKVSGANMVVSGAGGITGQQVTMVIKKGGTQFGSPITAPVDGGGTFTMSSPVITF